MFNEGVSEEITVHSFPWMPVLKGHVVLFSKSHEYSGTIVGADVVGNGDELGAGVGPGVVGTGVGPGVVGTGVALGAGVGTGM